MTHETHNSHHRSALKLARAMWGRRKWLAILAFAAPFSAAVSMIVAMPDLYRASATVLVKQERMPEEMAKLSATGELEPRLHLISQEILSRARLQELIARFDLYPKLRQRAAPEAVIERMRRDIQLERREVAQQWGRNITVAFTLSYQGWDPRTVAQVTNTLASFYVEENEKLRQRQVAGTQVVGTVDQLAQLKRELAELRSRYSDRYPDVIRLKAEIAALEQEREREELRRARAGASARRVVTPDPTPDIRSVQRELEAIEKKEQRLQEAIATRLQRDDNTAAGAQELEQLRRDYAATRELHGSLRKRQEEARLGEVPERGGGEQFRILDPAIAPNEPIAPIRIRLVLMGLILSTGIAGVTVLLAEQLDTSFHRLDELWAFTNLPILASVPRIVTRGDAWRGALRFGVVSILTVAGLALLVRVSYFVGRGGEQLVWMLAQRGS